jgi:hypothetical protein
LTEKPLLHADSGTLQRVVQPLARRWRKERQKPLISALSLKNEVKGKDEPGNDLHKRAGPSLEREQEIRGRMAQALLQPGDDLARIQAVGKRDLPELDQQCRYASWKIDIEGLYIANHRREGEEAETGECPCNSQQENKDGQ